MRNRLIAAALMAGLLLLSVGAALAMATESSGGAAAPSGSKRHHKRVKLPRKLKKIAQCESGGNPRAISPDGRYRGKYQFTRSTWRSIGGHGDPAKASEYHQDKRALKLYRREGTKPWPACSRRINN